METKTHMLEKRIADLENENKILRAAEENLLESEERFKLATQITTDLIYEWKPDCDRLIWYGDVDRLFGYSPGGFPREIGEAFNLVHPDDSDRLRNKILHTLESG